MWFLRWAHRMHTHHDVSWRQGWAVAAKVCPQLFGHSDANSFRRWRPADAEPAPPPASGKKSPLSVAERQELEVLVRSLVSRGVPVSLTVMHAIFAKKLKPVSISKTWVYYFLRSIGMSSRSTKAVAGRRKFSEETKKELQHLLCLKAKNTECALKPSETKLFGWDTPGFWAGCPGGGQQIEKKTFVFNWPLKHGLKCV